MNVSERLLLAELAAANTNQGSAWGDLRIKLDSMSPKIDDETARQGKVRMMRNYKLSFRAFASDVIHFGLANGHFPVAHAQTTLSQKAR